MQGAGDNASYLGEYPHRPVNTQCNLLYLYVLLAVHICQSIKVR